MAKITGPLLSQQASGRIGDILTFSERKSGSQVRFQKKQADIATADRAGVREIYILALARWKSFSEAEKETYENLARGSGKPMSGWNYFLGLCEEDPKTYLGLEVFYPLNKKNGAVVENVAQNNFHGTLMPTYPSNCPSYTTENEPKIKYALSFDGYDDGVSFGSAFDFTNLTGFTWNAFFYIPSLSFGPYYRLAVYFNDSSYIGFTIAGVRSILFSVNTNAGQKTLSDNVASPQGQWFMVSGVYEPTKLRIYRNGIIRQTGNISSSYANLGVTVNYVGMYRVLDYGFTGRIAKFMFFNRTLGADELLNIYNGFTKKNNK